MKVAIQWATNPPSDWEWVDSRNWTSLPKKDEPVGGEAIDASHGWIHRVCVQGVVFHGYDKYVVVHDVTQRVVWVAGINDDPEWWPVGTRHAQIWAFRAIEDPPQWDTITRQSLEFYGDDEVLATKPQDWKTTAGPVATLRWNRIRAYNENFIRYGIMVSDELDEAIRSFTAPALSEWIGDAL